MYEGYCSYMFVCNKCWHYPYDLGSLKSAVNSLGHLERFSRFTKWWSWNPSCSQPLTHSRGCLWSLICFLALEEVYNNILLYNKENTQTNIKTLSKNVEGYRDGSAQGTQTNTTQVTPYSYVFYHIQCCLSEHSLRRMPCKNRSRNGVNCQWHSTRSTSGPANECACEAHDFLTT